MKKICVVEHFRANVFNLGKFWNFNNNNLLLGSSITKSGLHRGPNTRYILYNDTIKIYKLELKPKYINNYNIYTTRIKKKKT